MYLLYTDETNLDPKESEFGRALRRGDGKKRPLIVTLYVPETTDRGVVANDRELFADAATFHSADLDSCVRKLRMLLGLPLTQAIK